MGILVSVVIATGKDGASGDGEQGTYSSEGERGLIASRSGRHLIGGVVSAVGDAASEGGGQSVLAFFGMDEDR